MNIEQTQIRELLLLPHGRDYCLTSPDFVGAENEDGEVTPLPGERYVPLSLFLSERSYSTHWEYGGLILRSEDRMIGEWLWNVPQDFQLSPEQEAQVAASVELWNSTVWEYRKGGSRESNKSWVAQGDGMRGSRTESTSFDVEWGEWVDHTGHYSPVFVRAWSVNGVAFGSLAAPKKVTLEERLLQERRKAWNAQRSDFPLWVAENREGLEKALEILVSIDCMETVVNLLTDREAAKKAAFEAKTLALKARAEKVAELKGLASKKLKTKTDKARIAELEKELA